MWIIKNELNYKEFLNWKKGSKNVLGKFVTAKVVVFFCIKVEGADNLKNQLFNVTQDRKYDMWHAKDFIIMQHKYIIMKINFDDDDFRQQVILEA